jgi:oligopeptide/dipeptide ABC transporter ATP-binding protein
MRALPNLGAAAERLVAIPGAVPDPGNLPPGCRFHPRCAAARPECSETGPALEAAGEDRLVRCPFWKTVDPMS